MPATVGKYFFLKNKANNLYLDACGLASRPEKISPGRSEVTVWTKREAAKGPVKNTQVWYWDAITSTLRNAIYNLCLDINEENNAVMNFLDLQSSMEHKENVKKSNNLNVNKSVLSKYSPKLRKKSLTPISPAEGPVTLQFPQQWRFNKTRQTIDNVVDDGKVLEVVGESPGAGAEVRVNHLSMKACQLWVMEPIPIQYFFIHSLTNQGHVMDVLGGKASPGVTVGLYVKKRNDNSQLWFEDEMGNIRSKLNDKMVLCATGTSLKIEHADNTTQRWVLCGNRIVSTIDYRYVIGIGKKRNSFSIDDNDTFYLCSSLYQGLESQHWDIQLV